MFFRASAGWAHSLAAGFALMAIAGCCCLSQDSAPGSGTLIEIRSVSADGRKLVWDIRLADGSRRLLDSTASGIQDRELQLSRGSARAIGTNGLELRAQAELTVAFPAVAGLRLVMPAGAILRASAIAAAMGLELQNETNGPVATRAELSDGARLEMQGPAAMRVEAFADNSYFVTGQGGVVLTTADGQRVTGTALEEPWTGGALRSRVPAAGGAARLERDSPTIRLTLDGVLGSEVRVEGAGTGGPTVLRSGVPEQFKFDNGAAVVLRHDGTRRALLWQVERGLFEMAVAGAGSARFVGMTGQSGELVFDVTAQVYDVRNPMAQGDLLVRLPGPVTARVGPHATFQFAPVDTTSFAATSVGGTVRLTSARQGMNQILQGGRVLVRGGVFAVGAGATNAAGRTAAATPPDGGVLTVTWPSPPTAVEVSGPGGTAVVQPGAEQRLAGPDSAGVQLATPAPGRIALRSEQARYRILPTPVSGLFVDLEPGATLELEYQSQARILVLHAPPANTVVLRAAFADGFSPLLDPGSTLTVWAGDGPIADGFAAGGLLFFEAAGAAATESFGLASTRKPLLAPDPSPPLTQLDTSRLPQPPVSPEQ